MLLKKLSPKRSAILALLAVNILLSTALAQTESIRHSFAGPPTDGGSPHAGLTLNAGTLYGTTLTGGSSACGCGTVFKQTLSGTESLVYSFAGQPDGAFPYAEVTLDRSGNIYGTTASGGANNYGAVFKIAPSGTETILHSFNIGNTDGYTPRGKLLLDAKGNIYGTTPSGGAHLFGAVFKINSSGTETLFHSFTGVDGATPEGGVISDTKGNIYGTTPGGGAYGYGTVFKITPSGNESVLYSFVGPISGPDGAFPYSDLVFDMSGNLYGTTQLGGAYGAGTIFEITPSAKETVLWSFGATGSLDGIEPVAGLVFDASGNLYGATPAGGSVLPASGTVFELTPSGTETVLHSFGGTTDGVIPYGGVVVDKSGNLYGTTFAGGKHAQGVVFKVVP
jgi:uncharacterized repeat protein (TIGR03803 family)